MIQLKGIHKYYRTGGDQSLHVLKGIDLEIREGELVSIMGSGATLPLACSTPRVMRSDNSVNALPMSIWLATML